MNTRTLPTMQHEWNLAQGGHRYIAGIDEAGRGAWAGPVVAAAVILPISQSTIVSLRGVNDSKKLSSRQRDEMKPVIQQTAVACGIGSAAQDEIDRLGIMAATRLAMQRAVEGLSTSPDALIIDAVRLPALALPQDVFYYADAVSLSVAAASIIAKTWRDEVMRQLDSVLPGYGFAAHKGYGTRSHQAALHQHGVTWAHRRSYAPIRRLCDS